MIVNCSNHPSNLWSEKQRMAAEKYGTILDLPFPTVNPEASTKEIYDLAEKIVTDLKKMNPDTVMCQGEFTLTYVIVMKLKALGIRVVSACSERKSVEEKCMDGTTKKTVVFQFVRFREY